MLVPLWYINTPKGTGKYFGFNHLSTCTVRRPSAIFDSAYERVSGENQNIYCNNKKYVGYNLKELKTSVTEFDSPLNRNGMNRTQAFIILFNVEAGMKETKDKYVRKGRPKKRPRN